MAREIVLDTETTGLDPKTGHRLIEIACIEIDDLLPTGAYFHRYIDPERDIDPDAERVHGISRASLIGKPKFDHADICDAFLDFVGDAPLVAHNAAFDRGFVNAELQRIGRAPLPDARWVCTFELAKRRFPGMYNSLDALCKRFKISLAERERHGALAAAYPPRPRPVAYRASEAELAAHARFVAGVLKDKAVWLRLEAEPN